MKNGGVVVVVVVDVVPTLSGARCWVVQLRSGRHPRRSGLFGCARWTVVFVSGNQIVEVKKKGKIDPTSDAKVYAIQSSDDERIVGGN